jgi:L-ascorbate metabolism protein UlaG (beta-lactamase superfamily)
MVEFVEKTQPAYVIPMHYGTYTSIRMDPEEIRSELETEKTKMLAFYPGQTGMIQFGSS